MTGQHNYLIKAFLFLMFILLAVYLVRFSPVSGFFSPRALTELVEEAGFWAPVSFIILYAAGVCLFIPGTVLTGIGAAIFGPYFGFVYVWFGAMLGASGAFFIARYLGRDFAASLIKGRLARYDQAIERNGFATVLYLRLVYFPFTPMNFGMGLTRVRFWDYFAGTGLGIIVGTFIFTFFIGTIRNVWLSGDWWGLLSWQVFLSLALLGFSLYLPKLVKRIKGES
ncbi:TVP38/TMEM64 family protein [Desulfonatronovibrio hydrogenovorans]|uniref:TVP38/TMEM64 family protein n=1 Tax=Desulfonatronovibrio hydrogenovorans TaxID=53245 RepID=UPI000491BD0E|nr:TVP38/TMEM64 family protein [Desulfonatronovibrio hydrogenovorans]